MNYDNGTLRDFDSFPDSLGRDTRVGADVIYNLSGLLAKGVVERIQVATTKWYPGTKYERLRNRWLIHVRFLDGPRGYQPDSGVSKVTNTNCVVRI